MRKASSSCAVEKKMSDLDESLLSDKVCKVLGTQRVYKEGLLFKRQRGLHGNQKKLKFQERFCRLTQISLDYYDPNPKKRVSLYFISMQRGMPVASTS